MPPLITTKLLTFYLYLFVTLDNIANLNIVVRLDVKTAILTYGYLLDIVLETTQRAELTSVDNDTIADDTDRRITLHATLAHDTSRNGTHLRDLEGLDFDAEML